MLLLVFQNVTVSVTKIVSVSRIFKETINAR